MPGYKKKKKDSEASDDDDYELPVDSFYDRPNKALLNTKRHQAARGDLSQGGVKKKRRSDYYDDDQIEKMLEEDDNESEHGRDNSSSQKEQSDSEKPKKVNKQQTPIVYNEMHPLDPIVELIVADRINSPKKQVAKGAGGKKSQQIPKDLGPEIEVKAKDEKKSESGTENGIAANEEGDTKMEDGGAEEKKEDKVKSQSASGEESDGDQTESSTAVVETNQQEFLVKYKGVSYLECKWLTENDFTQLGYQCQQKLKRYKLKKEKLAMGLLQQEAPKNLEPGEYFDHHYKLVDKVLTSTNLFPIIHPRQAKNVVGSWRERCILVLQNLVSFHQDGFFYSTPFLFLRTDERSVMDFTTINNRLYTIPSSSMLEQARKDPNKQPSFYTGPKDFWADLGQVLIEGMSNYASNCKEYYFVRRLRELAYYFYLAWKKQLKEIHAYKLANPVIPKPCQDLSQIVQKLIHLEGLVSLSQKAFQTTPSTQNQQILNNQKAEIAKQLQNIQKMSAGFAVGSKPPASEIGDDVEKIQTYNQICDLLPKFIKNCLASQNGQSHAVGVAQDPAQIKAQLQKCLAEIVPRAELGKQSDPKSDMVPPGSLVLGDKLLKDLGSGEQEYVDKEPSFDWLLKKGEPIEQVLEEDLYKLEDIYQKLQGGAPQVDPIYLVKWQNLSYLDTTWEHASTIRDHDETDSKIKDFERFNRSLDNNSRQKMMGFGYAHKQIIKIYQKKMQAGRKVDHRNAEEIQTREMLSKLLKFEGMNQQKGYFQYDFANNLVPQFRLGQKMKDYQVLGLNWMLRAFQDDRNIVLADEMGLGKTIQSISLLDHLIKICKIRGPFLIIAPLSTLDHWKAVAETWTYMNVVVYHDRGGQEGRAAMRAHDWFYTDVTNKGTITQKSKLIKFNLMVTSYEVFNSDLVDVLKEVPFQYVVVDEAHRLKNKGAKTLVLLKEHPCRRILLLTGTPVQNNTKELFTLLNYIESENFNSFEKFMDEYGDLKTADQVERLHKIIKPHFLRRLKDEVEDTIPPLKETVIDVGLTQLQTQYYKGIYGENLGILASLTQSGIKTFNFNNIDIQLRKCCNHLYLLKGVEEELTAKIKSEKDSYKQILESSGKMILLDKFIEKYQNDNHKMLVFSQFKGMIDIIKDYLTMKGVRHEVLTGNVKSQDRITAIQRFNEDNQFGVFLLTTRAGGLGINLTKARVVVIYDSDWNPQNDLQAIARAHRIGQKFEVEVYRFITAKTYEQQMFDRASKKLGMEQALFQKGAFGDAETGQNDMDKVNPEEVEKLLKFGAYAFLDDEQDEDLANQSSLKIEDILKGNKSKKGGKKSYTLQKTTFNVESTPSKDGAKGSPQKKEKLNINDPNFWEKVLPFDGYNPKQLMHKFRSKKNEIVASKESQSQFLKDISNCVKELIEAKQNDPTLVIDEDIYDLLKKISKMKSFDHKYRDKAAVQLDKLLHVNEYLNIVDDSLNGFGRGALGRQAKKKPVDYQEKTTISGRRKNKSDRKKGVSQDEEEEEDDGLSSDQEDIPMMDPMQDKSERIEGSKESEAKVSRKTKKITKKDGLSVKMKKRKSSLEEDHTCKEHGGGDDSLDKTSRSDSIENKRDKKAKKKASKRQKVRDE